MLEDNPSGSRISSLRRFFRDLVVSERKEARTSTIDETFKQCELDFGISLKKVIEYRVLRGLIDK